MTIKGLPTQAELDQAIASAREVDETRTIEGAVAALSPCAQHCTVCDGDDHHWMMDCDDAGEPLMVCKHCPAWRDMKDGDFEEGADA